MTDQPTFFAPQLFVRNVTNAITFYKAALGAAELRSWKNEDGSIHVAELSIDGAMFHLHEEVARKNELSPETSKSTSIIMGVFVIDPDILFDQAIAAGATMIHPVQDYDYKYRQGVFADPFGHHWMIEKRIP